jgi:hypothetical protein
MQSVADSFFADGGFRTMRGLVTAIMLAALATGCSGSGTSSGGAQETTASVAASTTTVPPTTTTTSAEQQLEADKMAIRHQIEYLNDAYRQSVGAGINALAASNYHVLNGSYTAEQCTAFYSAEGGDQIAVDWVIDNETILPSPGWTTAAGGKQGIPDGRVYSFNVDATTTHVPSGQRDTETRTIHATVMPDGTAKMFWACEE